MAERAQTTPKSPQAAKGRTSKTRSRRPAEEEASDQWLVIDDLPRPIPIGRGELAVLETYLGAEIDLLLLALKP